MVGSFPAQKEVTIWGLGLLELRSTSEFELEHLAQTRCQTGRILHLLFRQTKAERLVGLLTLRLRQRLRLHRQHQHQQVVTCKHLKLNMLAMIAPT